MNSYCTRRTSPRIKLTTNLNVTIKCLVLELQCFVFLTWFFVFLGKRHWKMSTKWWERRATEWNGDLIVGCVSPGHLVVWAEQCKRCSCGSSWMEAAEDDDSETLWLKRPHNYPPRPFSWTALAFFCFSFQTPWWRLFTTHRQICTVDRWTDVSGGWTALWVDAVSAVRPVALVIVSELCLNKALSKSLRWRGARCLISSLPVTLRWVSLLNICLH